MYRERPRLDFSIARERERERTETRYDRKTGRNMRSDCYRYMREGRMILAFMGARMTKRRDDDDEFNRVMVMRAVIALRYAQMSSSADKR